MSFLSYRTISYLSIDVALGAVISSAFIARVFNTHVYPVTYIVLGLVVWSIYTFDHLLDARTSKGELLERHFFHRRWFVPISRALIFTLLVIVSLLSLLPIETILLGTAIGLFVIVYFISIHFLPWQKVYHKEVLAALVYFSGTIIGPITTLEGHIEIQHIIILGSYFLVILLNLFIFSGFEVQADVNNNFPSIYRVAKQKQLRAIILILSLIAISLSIVVFNYYGLFASLLLVSMILILMLTNKLSSKPNMLQINRYLGDGIFLLPAIYIL